MAERSFHVIEPRWWNELSSEIKCIHCEMDFRKGLKTYLFKKYHG